MSEQQKCDPKQDQPKQEAAPEQASSTALELRTNDGQVMVYDYGEYAGVGSNNLPTSGFLPYLTVLQPLSKALQEGEKYVKDAKAGQFLLGDENRLFDGKKGLIFVPLHDRHLIIEKTSLDGKGKIIARHDGDPKGPVATALRQKFGNNKAAWKSEAGNFMVERHDLTGILYASVEDVAAQKPIGACIVGFERTKMRAYDRMSKGFNKYPPQQRPPLFALQMHLSTQMEKGEKGDYYNIVVKFPVQDDFARSLIPPSAPFFRDFAKQCSDVIAAIGSGALQAKEETDHDDTPDDGGVGKSKDIPF